MQQKWGHLYEQPVFRPLEHPSTPLPVYGRGIERKSPFCCDQGCSQGGWSEASTLPAGVRCHSEPPRMETCLGDSVYQSVTSQSTSGISTSSLATMRPFVPPRKRRTEASSTDRVSSSPRIRSSIAPNRSNRMIRWPLKMPQILIVTRDGGESYEALYAIYRFRKEDWRVTVAAPSIRRLHLVMHAFEPGWDTYVERPSYGLEADQESCLADSEPV